MDNLVETLEEAGAISLLEGSGTACNRPNLTQVGQKLPAGKGFADGVLCERAALGPKHPSSLLQAARGERDVPGDHDVVLTDMLDDPVICRVKLTAYENQLD